MRLQAKEHRESPGAAGSYVCKLPGCGTVTATPGYRPQEQNTEKKVEQALSLLWPLPPFRSTP